jgi:proteasome lid subunit RPN8/RPN11
LSAAVTAVKLSVAPLAGIAASHPSPKPTLASVDAQCRIFMAVSLSFVVMCIIGKPGATASTECSG